MDELKSAEGLIPQAQIDIRAMPEIGLSLATTRKYAYGVATYKGRPCRVSQYCDHTGQVIGQQVRYTDGQEPKYALLGKAKKGLFGLDKVRGDGKRLVITEGQEDALAVCEVMDSPWWPVVSIPNGVRTAREVLAHNLESLDRFESIIFCFDEDDAGRKAVEECLDLFRPGVARITSLPAKDAMECVKGGMRDKLKAAVFEAKKYVPEGLVTGDDILTAILAPRNMEGTPYPWGCLNEKLKGMRPKELVLLTGGTGGGKSTVSRHLAEHWLSLGFRVGYVALEESIQQSALGIYGIRLSKNFQLTDELPEDEIREIHEQYGHRLHLYDHFGSSDPEALISKLRFLAKGHGCDVLFLDHISIAISGLALDDERKALDKMMTELRSLVEETEVALYLVCHLKRPKEGSHEEGKPVRISDLRGSQSLGQLPDIIMAGERHQQAAGDEERNTIKIRVLKNRPVGLTGLAGKLRYDHESGRLAEDTGDFGAVKDEGEVEDFS